MTEETTLEEIADRVADAITCSGFVFHMRGDAEYEAGLFSSFIETESWVDLEHNVGRRRIDSTFTSEEALQELEGPGQERLSEQSIVREEGAYSGEAPDRPASKRRPPQCHGPNREALGLVIDCEGPLQDFETSIEPDTSYGGRPAFAIMSEGESRGSDETYFTTARLFFDRESYLPLGTTTTGTLDYGEVVPVRSDMTYELDFLPLDSLADDFFDPASLGYAETDPEEPLDGAEVTVYWLGREFDGSDQFPPLALDRVFVRPRDRTPGGGFVAQITYRPLDDEFGLTHVVINLIPSSGSPADPEKLIGRCDEMEEIPLPDATAFLRRHHHDRASSGSRCLPHDRYSGDVYFQDVLVEFDAPTTNTGAGSVRSPYDSEEGIRLLVEALRLRE